MYLPDTIAIPLQASHACVCVCALAFVSWPTTLGHIVCLALSAYLICLLAHERRDHNQNQRQWERQWQKQSQVAAAGHVKGTLGFEPFVARYRKLF